jgi:hypothetical protein
MAITFAVFGTANVALPIWLLARVINRRLSWDTALAGLVSFGLGSLGILILFLALKGRQ